MLSAAPRTRGDDDGDDRRADLRGRGVGPGVEGVADLFARRRLRRAVLLDERNRGRGLLLERGRVHRQTSVGHLLALLRPRRIVLLVGGPAGRDGRDAGVLELRGGVLNDLVGLVHLRHPLLPVGLRRGRADHGQEDAGAHLGEDERVEGLLVRPVHPDDVVEVRPRGVERRDTHPGDHQGEEQQHTQRRGDLGLDRPVGEPPGPPNGRRLGHAAHLGSLVSDQAPPLLGAPDLPSVAATPG